MFHFIVLFFLCSYDWYHPIYGPILMYLGILIVFLATLLKPTKIKLTDFLVVLILAAIPLWSGLMSAAYWAAFVGLIFCIFRNSLITNLVRGVVPLMVLHLGAFYMLLLLAQFGLFLNVTEALGLMPQRTHYEFNYRPSGLLLEPNSFCVMMFLLSFIASRIGAELSNLLKISILLAVLLSESLWAIGLLPFLIFLLYPNIRLPSLTIVILAVSPVLALISIGIYERFSAGLAGEELSFIIRLGSLEEIFSRVSFFGEGFDYVDWISPSIFLPWLLIKSGIFWSVFFVAYIMGKVGIRLAFLLLVPLFFTQPLLSNFVFWLALARFSRHEK